MIFVSLIAWAALAAGLVVADALGGWQLVVGLAFTFVVFMLLDRDVRRWLKGKQ